MNPNILEMLQDADVHINGTVWQGTKIAEKDLHICTVLLTKGYPIDSIPALLTAEYDTVEEVPVYDSIAGVIKL